MVDMAQPFLQPLKVVKRVEFVGGDVLAEIPVEADLYLLKGVLRQWDDDDARTILRNCRAAMPDWREARHHRASHARARRGRPAAIMLDLHMMTITGGRARSLAEFEALLPRQASALPPHQPDSRTSLPASSGHASRRPRSLLA